MSGLLKYLFGLVLYSSFISETRGRKYIFCQLVLSLLKRIIYKFCSLAQIFMEIRERNCIKMFLSEKNPEK